MVKKKKRKSLPIPPSKKSRLVPLRRVASYAAFHPLPKMGKNPLTRRQFVKRISVLAGIMAAELVGVKSARSKARPKHEIMLGFSMHHSEGDVEHFDKVIERAKRMGVPFDAIGHEAAGYVLKSDLKTRIAEENAGRQVMRQQVQILIQNGMPRKEVYTMLFEEFVRQNPNVPMIRYNAAMKVLAIKHNLPLVPVEWYSKHQGKSKIGSYGRFVSLADKARKIATLEGQHAATEKAYSVLGGYIRNRNAVIVQSVRPVIKTLKSEYPKIDRKKNVRILYTLGTAHRGLLKTMEVPGVETQVTWGNTIPGVSQAAMEKLEQHPPRKLSQIERMRFVIENNLYPITNGYMEAHNFKEAFRIHRLVLKVTQRDFDALNKLTSNMSPRQRANAIADYLLAKK